MLRGKKILITVLVALILIVNKSNAAVQYTRNFPSNDGTIEINLTGLQLEESKQYEFTLVTKGGTPETWNLITDYTNTTAKLVLNSVTNDIKNVLKTTDNGQVFVRKKDSTTYIVDRLDVDLKLPYLKAVNYTFDANYGNGVGWYDLSNSMYNAIGGANRTYYKFEKITDKNFIEEFLKDKRNTDRLETMLPTPPDTGYSKGGYFSGKGYNDGLYIIWINQLGDGCKTIQGAIIHDGLPNATSLKDYGVDTEAPETPGQTPEVPNQTPETPTQTPETPTKTPDSKQDPTTAKQDIPKAGLKYGVIVVMLVMAMVALYLYKKNNQLKGIEKL